MRPGANPLARSARLPAAAAAVKGWTRAALDLGGETAVSVNELACTRPDCPPSETVILALPAGSPAIRLSIHKAIVEISEQDVVAACLNGAARLHAAGRRER